MYIRTVHMYHTYIAVGVVYLFHRYGLDIGYNVPVISVLILIKIFGWGNREDISHFSLKCFYIFMHAYTVRVCRPAGLTPTRLCYW